MLAAALAEEQKALRVHDRALASREGALLSFHRVADPVALRLPPTVRGGHVRRESSGLDSGGSVHEVVEETLALNDVAPSPNNNARTMMQPLIRHRRSFGDDYLQPSAVEPIFRAPSSLNVVPGVPRDPSSSFQMRLRSLTGGRANETEAEVRMGARVAGARGVGGAGVVGSGHPRLPRTATILGGGIQLHPLPHSTAARRGAGEDAREAHVVLQNGYTFLDE
ncbi:hypothetical protein EON66_01530 [archaeon]|nr:MAG: hypothetical protein EON66_01530 [archaeon]